jgi:hypothetical protein
MGINQKNQEENQKNTPTRAAGQQEVPFAPPPTPLVFKLELQQ